MFDFLDPTALLQWSVDWNVFKKASFVAYVIFAVGIFSIAAQYYQSIMRGQKPAGQFPNGYFTMLIVQLIPLMVTGIAIHDEFLIGSRLTTFVLVLVAYGLVSAEDGELNSWWHLGWITFWLTVTGVGTMTWYESPGFRDFIHDHEKWISYLSVATMLAFAIKGQGTVARTLFNHFLEGHYSVKRTSLQVDRFLCFAFQAIGYWYAPSKSDPISIFGLFKVDVVFLNSVIGMIGVSVVLVFALLGFLRGTELRILKRYHAAR